MEFPSGNLGLDGFLFVNGALLFRKRDYVKLLTLELLTWRTRDALAERADKGSQRHAVRRIAQRGGR